jgi:hypothetical protein
MIQLQDRFTLPAWTGGQVRRLFLFVLVVVLLPG